MTLTSQSHILVVDDEPELAESLSDFLRRTGGFTVTVAPDGQKAIDILQATLGKETEIDLVLLDMRMPVISGFDVLGWIRNHQALQYTRVVLLTAAAGSNDKVNALSAGADDYITKPYYPQELLARVQTILRTQQLEKQLQRQSQQLATLNRIGHEVTTHLEVREVMATAVRGIDTILNVQLAIGWMREGGLLRCQHLQSHQIDQHPDFYPAITPGQGLIGHVFEQQQGIFTNTPKENPQFITELDHPPHFDLHNMIVVPIVVRGRSVGVLTAYNKERHPFNEVDVGLMASLAISVSEAIENAWLFQRIRLRQQELLENRNTLQALIDGILLPIYTISTDWKLVAINQAKAEQLNTTPKALIKQGETCYKTFFNRATPCEHCQVAHTLRQKEAVNWSHRWFAEDHLPREWDITAYPIPSTQAGSARAVIVWQDRTEERRLESSLMQAGKLAAIGQLAAGVAHEINNPLTAINANAQILKMVIPPSDENYESVDLIFRAGERAANVVQGLLNFSRQEHYNFTKGDINDSIQQALSLVRYQLTSANAQAITHFDQELPLINASWKHLASVWLNLIVNARDAVQTRAQPREIEITTRLLDDQIQVIVRDNGKGMSEAELKHIFEPFYTTKDPGQGTGLGLATTHRIIEQHQGEINVVSAPNEGTSFVVRLPIQPIQGSV